MQSAPLFPGGKVEKTIEKKMHSNEIGGKKQFRLYGIPDWNFVKGAESRFDES